MTKREALYEILGQPLADDIINDPILGPDWAVMTALCKIEAKGGPQTEAERQLCAAHDRQKIPEKCTDCGGSGSVDSGGVSPWGAGIGLPCPRCSYLPNQ